MVGVEGEGEGSLLTRQMEWVTGGNGDEKAVLHFMNKCKHSDMQLLLLVISVRMGGGVNVQLESLQVQSNENAQVTGAFNCIYGKAKSEGCGGLLRMKA